MSTDSSSLTSSNEILTEFSFDSYTRMRQYAPNPKERNRRIMTFRGQEIKTSVIVALIIVAILYLIDFLK